MLKIRGTLPVKTRLPFAAWAVAAVVTLYSLTSSFLHAYAPAAFDRTNPRAEQSGEPLKGVHQARV